ncbi:hypothetical protein EYF80_002271 [Liparis tanakae]|uniref:Uncharacterized protein n=1 Tax=Liparis tanakae TaxID=230148 RepID=A0A4Z2JCJ5_9TELE|nr:hypothetical protein EYF80_002271 [Liparis tanakae]
MNEFVKVFQATKGLRKGGRLCASSKAEAEPRQGSGVSAEMNSVYLETTWWRGRGTANVLHSDPGALIQSAHYLLQGPP